MAKKAAQKTVEKLFDLLHIDGSVEVVEGDETIDVLLNTPDTGMVIGYHGDMLESLQLVLSLCVARSLGEFKRVSLEVGDYKKNRQEYLQNLAMNTREKVLVQGQALSLPELKSWERRVIHLMLQGDPDVVSESVGEGKNRTLLIKPKE